MQCLILAGGLGTRMRSHDGTVPKALLPVAGRPFADWQLDLLATSGVKSVIYSIGHMGSQIRDHVGDGSRWGLNVTYVQEEGALLGTAGAIRLAVDQGVVSPTFSVMYGDSYVQLSLPRFFHAFSTCGLPAMMVIIRNEGRWDASNATFNGQLVTEYEKGTAKSTKAYIDYGVLAFTRTTILQIVPPGRFCDLADVLTSLSRGSELAGFEVFERFFEVGSPQGLKDLESHLMGGR